MNNIKVCYFGDSFPPEDVGGAEIQLFREAVAVSEAGVDAFVITTGRSGYKFEKQGKLRIYRIPIIFNYQGTDLASRFFRLGISIINPLNMAKIKKILIQEKPNIVHSQHIPILSYGILKTVDRKKCGLVHTFHSYHFECPKGGLIHKNMELCTNPYNICKLYGYVFRKYLCNPDAIIAPSSYIQEKLINSGYPRNRIHQIWQPIDKKIFSDQPPNKRILFVGRIDHNKGLHDLIYAAKALVKESIQFCIVGDGPALNFYKQLSDGIPNISFEGRIPNNKLNSYYSESSIVVVPSVWHEILNTVILEAMAYGRPVIATDVGGNRDMIIPGVTGELVLPNRPDLLAEAIKKIINNRNILMKMSTEAYRRTELFSTERHVSKLFKVYKSICEYIRKS